MADESNKQAENMLVRSEDLDQLLTLAGEVIIMSSNQGILSKGLQNLVDQKRPVDIETLTIAKDLAGATAMLSAELHHLVQAIRTVNLKDLGFRFRRLVRNTSRTTGKPIAFEIIGDETSIDKAIVEKLYDPIAHQLRNAIDHGIEDMQVRERLGKPKEGKVTLNIFNTEQETFIEISDDGAGLDMESLRRKGIEKGLVRPEDPFSEDVALRVMCSPGMSTAKAVSEISGRGVGMDVVKNHIDALGGSVSFVTEPGKGTTFTFRIPLLSAVNIVDALVVRAGRCIYAFPIANVVASMTVSYDRLRTPMDEGDMVEYLGDFLAVYDLNHLINKRPARKVARDHDMLHLLIVEHKTYRIALAVSEFMAPQKLVIIPFHEKFSVEGLVGSTILGARQLGFIVDVPSLIDLAMERTDRSAGQDQARTPESLQQELASSISEQEDAKTETTGMEQPTESALTAEEEGMAQAFVGELEKLCQELNQAVFALEANPEDADSLNAAFRLFHTIKGNLIMMGLPLGGDTVHSVESILDCVRGGEHKMSEEIMDIVMEGVSYVEDLTQKVKNQTWQDHASEDILNRSRAILPETTFDQEAVEDVASGEIVLSAEAVYRALDYRRKRRHFYRLYVEFDADPQPSFLVACLIYRRVSEAGDILGTLPTISDVEKGMMGGKMKFLFVSDHEHAVLLEAFQHLFREHYGATGVDLTSIAY